MDRNARHEAAFVDLFGLLALAFGTGALFTWLAGLLPTTSFLNKTRLHTIPGSRRLSNIMLYTMVALIAANADFRELVQAPAYMVCIC